MNIDDVATKDIELPKGCLFAAIFDHQHALEVKYAPIERRNGFWSPDRETGVLQQHLDDAEFQNWLKNMFWRATEEIAEALEIIPNLEHWWKEWDTDHNIRHFFEELIDALHFITATSLTVGIKPQEVSDRWTTITYDMQQLSAETVPMTHSIKEWALEIIISMGLAANCLKNKPWKLSQMQTDVPRFKQKMMDVWGNFAALWAILKCNTSDMYRLYCCKNMVNQFRQKTNY